jgi:hypothetical protein
LEARWVLYVCNHRSVNGNHKTRSGTEVSQPRRDGDRGFHVRADLVGPIRPVYVALAERESCELVTADTRMVATLKPTFPFIIDLASLP